MIIIKFIIWQFSCMEPFKIMFLFSLLNQRTLIWRSFNCSLFNISFVFCLLQFSFFMVFCFWGYNQRIFIRKAYDWHSSPQKLLFMEIWGRNIWCKRDKRKFYREFGDRITPYLNNEGRRKTKQNKKHWAWIFRRCLRDWNIKGP